MSVRRCSRIVALVAAVFAAFVGSVRVAVAQTPQLVVDGPPGSTLSTLTPSFTLRVLGLPAGVRPLQYVLLISRSPDFGSAFEQVISRPNSQDTIVTVRVLRLLSSGAQIYWKGQVTLPDGKVVESLPSTQRQVPNWLTLIEPAPFGGGAYATRRPRFVWRSAQIDPDYGKWTYVLSVTGDRSPGFTTSSSDTTTIAPTELAANTLYRWQVSATVAETGESITLDSKATFQIVDPSLPTATLVYQNFPNPFPSPTAFATCFWFDIGAGGATVTMDILDLRGTMVKSIIPATRFARGRYGIGDAGSGSNCDNRFTWNGTATDGRTVPSGVYLLRFKAGLRVSFKKILFNGR